MRLLPSILPSDSGASLHDGSRTHNMTCNFVVAWQRMRSVQMQQMSCMPCSKPTVLACTHVCEEGACKHPQWLTAWNTHHSCTAHCYKGRVTPLQFMYGCMSHAAICCMPNMECNRGSPVRTPVLPCLPCACHLVIPNYQNQPQDRHAIGHIQVQHALYTNRPPLVGRLRSTAASFHLSFCDCCRTAGNACGWAFTC